jgi:hypothetical protein
VTAHSLPRASLRDVSLWVALQRVLPIAFILRAFVRLD